MAMMENRKSHFSVANVVAEFKKEEIKINSKKN